MLELRLLCDNDLPLVEKWLNTDYVKRWYEIPSEGFFISDWLHEISEREKDFKWITYLIAMYQNRPIGMCLHYKSINSIDEDFGSLVLDNAYSIDYLIGEKEYIGKGLGKKLVNLLVDRIFSFEDAQIVTADINIENMASRGTLLSCGFSLLEGSKHRYIKKK